MKSCETSEQTVQMEQTLNTVVYLEIEYSKTLTASPEQPWTVFYLTFQFEMP